MPPSEKPFQDPEITLSKIYTRTGDEGRTSLVGGQRVAKDDVRIECYGTVDELNSFIGVALETAASTAESHPALEALIGILRRIQHELFNLGSVLATLPGDLHPRQPRVTALEVTQLEREIDRMNGDLPALGSFVLPGGSRLNAELHVARTVCRRAERLAVALARREEVDPEAIRYLNRLSDALFVFSRWASHKMGAAEILWDPNRAASASEAE
jgi:cob(I)alamin adenosyltransferase